MKRCTICKAYKDEQEFYKNKSRPDGLDNRCKNCARDQARRRQQSPRAKAYDKERQQTDKRKDYAKQLNQTPERRRKVALYKAKRKSKYPEKFKAVYMVDNAVRDKRLVHPSQLQCNHCNGQAQEYHHWSYEPQHWLDVIPLCRDCHKKLHKAMAQ